MSEIEVKAALKDKILASINAQGPGQALSDGRRLLTEKRYPEIQEFRVEIWPNESQHPGRPHCKVTTDRGAVTVDIETAEIITGNTNRWASAIEAAVRNHRSGLMQLWNDTRPDTQKL